VIVVEHDEDTIRASDFVIDMGPGAGVHGGRIVAQGTPAEILKNPKSLTGAIPHRQVDKIYCPGRAAQGRASIHRHSRRGAQQPEEGGRGYSRWASSWQ
jgi:excinuclease UvrABC ATPase subunit